MRAFYTQCDSDGLVYRLYNSRGGTTTSRAWTMTFQATAVVWSE